MIAEGVIPANEADDLFVCVGVFIHWDASDDKKIYDYNYQATKESIERALGKKNYDEVIITSSFPNKPDGTPIKYRSDVKTGLMFTVAKNKTEGEGFLAKNKARAGVKTTASGLQYEDTVVGTGADISVSKPGQGNIATKNKASPRLASAR